MMAGATAGRRGEPVPRIIMLGALSSIAQATARLYAIKGARMVLAGRSAERLDQQISDLRARGAGDCITWSGDLTMVENPHPELAAMADKLGGPVDAVFVFYGQLGDVRKAEADPVALKSVVDVNFTSAAGWCVAAAGLLERQKRGTLIAISSVAGDRGRQSNYVYGAAKAGLTVLMEGLAHRLAPSGARAVVVKLGFVDTAMTAHINKGGPLWAKPEAIARRLVRLAERPTKPVLYMPWFWRPIMGLMRTVPAPIFHKTKL